MKCPSCHGVDTSVVDSRVTEDGFAIRRRRECDRCGYRFSTMEEVELFNLTVIKRDGRREPYDREKIENGLRKALEKRPVTADRLRKLIGQVERDVQMHGRTEITSADLGELVMKRLQKVDQVAYIRFASVYRQFQDVATFRRELNRLMRTRSKNKK